MAEGRSSSSLYDLEAYNSTHSLVPATNSRQLALSCFRPNKDMIETSKDYVNKSRKILMKEISIQDKKEETKRLVEFIQMEQEKLAESKRTFDEDKEGYEKYLEQLRADVALIEEEVRELNNKKNEK